MKHRRTILFKQLFFISVIIVIVIIISIGVLLPQILLPIYEKNIYQYLKQPLQFVNDDISKNKIDENVAYLYVYNDNIVYSDNFFDIINIDPSEILKKTQYHNYGKFKYKKIIYYYYTSYIENGVKISITTNNYIDVIQNDILYAMFPVLLLIIIAMASVFYWWSRRLILKIEHLKMKIDNLDNDNYKDSYVYKTDDEFKVLSDAIDNMRETLKKQEEYKNQMYQSISHDLKTPLAVIDSYVEASEDGMVEEEEVHKVIKEQLKKLENKVHSLLYLNKINYIKDSKFEMKQKVDIVPIISSSVQKFKYIKPNVNFVVSSDKKTIFRGSNDMWETIVDNLLNNFIRYAENSIKITIKNNKIIFYNDGPNIDDGILNNIFNPYIKGLNGQFGLGLSIIRKSLQLAGYEISVKNEKKGVSFMIK